MAETELVKQCKVSFAHKPGPHAASGEVRAREDAPFNALKPGQITKFINGLHDDPKISMTTVGFPEEVLVL